MTGRLIVTGQVVIDIVLRIPELPAAGADVFAHQHGILAGGEFNTMAAAARDGARVVYTGGRGTGQFAAIADEALVAEGIRPTAEPAEIDTGFSVVIVDDKAERTFLSVRGAECVARPEDLRLAAVQSDDIVLVSGYSLLDPAKSAILLAGLKEIPASTRVAFDPGPMIDSLPRPALAKVLGRMNIWTSNEVEASQLDLPGHATTLIRMGARGCLWNGELIPGFRVAAMDTNGAGDAHTGVFLAGLLAGDGRGSMEEIPIPNSPSGEFRTAARRANAAAAIAVTRFGPATSPTSAEIDQLLATADRE